MPCKSIRYCAFLILLLTTLSILPVSPVPAQEVTPNTSPIAAGADTVSDARIEARIDAIFSQIEALDQITVNVDAGVVTLSGSTMDQAAAERAVELVNRVEGVVTVESNIERDLSVERRLNPIIGQTQSLTSDAISLLPLLALAVVVFAAAMLIGRWIAGLDTLWTRITPNAFIADLVRSSIRILAFIIGVVGALALLDATAFLGAFLGAAGFIGLAVGFAVRDTIENYIASIMLSIRQPFRPNDHVVIDDKEGRVLRLTSRATILMTLDGNHLRIPNATVFKAVILNYTRNPKRRFDFELGVDADDDPLAAIETGLATLKSHDFVLDDPAPFACIQQVGDSNIVILYAGWVDQEKTSYMQARSVALASVKTALEAAGFALPEPIYRLRFDNGAAMNISEATSQPAAETAPPKPTSRPQADISTMQPEEDIERQVDAERRSDGNEEDLLSKQAPIE